MVAFRRLSPVNDAEWRMEVTARNWLGEIREVTKFSWQGCIPRSTYYGYERSGLGKDRKAEMFLDVATGVVRIEGRRRPGEYQTDGNITDKLSQTLALQCMLARGDEVLQMQVADESGVDQVRYRRLGTEWLETPAGKVNAIKVEKIRAPDSARRTVLWFAVDHDYDLVQMVQHENDKQYRMIIRSFAE